MQKEPRHTEICSAVRDRPVIAIAEPCKTTVYRGAAFRRVSVTPDIFKPIKRIYNGTKASWRSQAVGTFSHVNRPAHTRLSQKNILRHGFGTRIVDNSNTNPHVTFLNGAGEKLIIAGPISGKEPATGSREDQ